MRPEIDLVVLEKSTVEDTARRIYLDSDYSLRGANAPRSVRDAGCPRSSRIVDVAQSLFGAGRGRGRAQTGQLVARVWLESQWV